MYLSTRVPMHLLGRVLVPSLALAATYASAADTGESALEEVIVTAQKREQSLQETPISIAVLGQQQLEIMGVNSLADLGEGAIPSFRVQPLGIASSNLVMSIRGNGPADAAQVTREASVAIYLDGVYIGRTHALGMELADLARIEVLRGPQGTLFGRNAVGGAVSMVSNQPTGEFGIKQTLGAGRFDDFRSITRVDLPEFAGIRAKFDYIHSERDGWVNNTAPGEADYTAYDKDGGRLSLQWQPSDAVTVDYSYDLSDVESVQNYFQFYEDNGGAFGRERERRTRTRAPVTSLDPTTAEQEGHALTVSWALSDNLSLKSISAYRELEEENNNNFAGTLYFNGLKLFSELDQEQFSQELQLIGSSDSVEWVAGLYYFDEDVAKTTQEFFTLDFTNFFGNGFLAPITPPTTFDALLRNADSPPRIVEADAESLAVYAQVTWSPTDRLHLTGGLRRTEDERSGSRFITELDEFDLDTDNTDFSVTVDYQWTDSVSTYAKWSTAYKAGGVNTGSTSFVPYDEEDAETFEIGLKSELLDRRVRINAAVFTTEYEDMQLDFSDPVTPTIVETINAANTVDVDGFELEVTAVPLDGLTLGLSYTYLDGDMPAQPNPLAGGALRQFRLAQTPPHAGALSVDYSFAPMRLGLLTAHLDITSTDQYAYVQHGGFRQDGYTLFNARVSLADIRFGEDSGSLKVSVWGKNLTDEEYVVYAFPVGALPVSVPHAFGDPRTAGVDVTYEF